MTDLLRVSLDVVVRQLEERDLGGFHDWYAGARDDGFRRNLQRQRAGEIVYLVAEANDKPVGHLGVDLVSVRGRVVLWQFGVLPPLQSNGIGSAMIEEAEQAARDRGFIVAEIGAETDNPRARSLYERLGYSLISERDGEWILRKDLFAEVGAS